jgi:hypothetical protein
VSQSAPARYALAMPLILYDAKRIAARRMHHQRKKVYRRVLQFLRIASVMMDIAEENEPGPDRLSTLWCAAGELANAERFASMRKIPIGKSLKRRWRRYSEIARESGDGEFHLEALDGEIKIVGRDKDGAWYERLERVH